jgi:hypothetical protein
MRVAFDPVQPAPQSASVSWHDSFSFSQSAISNQQSAIKNQQSKMTARGIVDC